jgi:Tfp pilus assembly protein PilN
MSTTQSAPTGLRAAQAPRVNLLPDEIARAIRLRETKTMIVVGLAAVAAGVGAVTYFAMQDAGNAQDALTTAQATNAQLQGEAAKYEDVPAHYAKLQMAQNQLATAMADEVRYSYLLNDLSLTIPTGVWVHQLSVTQPVGAAGGDSVKGSWGTEGIASIQFQGEATSLTQVSAWLDSLARARAYTDPYVSNAARKNPGDPSSSFTFSSDVTVTSKALSNRYAAKAGS